MFETLNYLEAIFWCLIGLGFSLHGIERHTSNHRKKRIAAVIFIFFGLSDIIEAQTGAWWRPGWLLAWKTVCVTGLLVLRVNHYSPRPPR